MQPTYEKIPDVGQMQLNFINTLPCDVNVNYYVADDENGTAQLNTTSRTFATPFLTTVDDVIVEATLVDPGNCILQLGDGSGGVGSGTTGLVSLGYANETQGYSVLITLRDSQLVATRLLDPEQLAKSDVGKPLLG